MKRVAGAAERLIYIFNDLDDLLYAIHLLYLGDHGIGFDGGHDDDNAHSQAPERPVLEGTVRPNHSLKHSIDENR